MRTYAWSKRSQYRGKHILDQLKNLGHLDPMMRAKEISPRPLLIIHRKRGFLASVHHAHDIYAQAEEAKRIVIAEGWAHNDGDPFFSSAERENGAIRISRDWLNDVFKV